jgi:hypothetical protein
VARRMAHAAGVSKRRHAGLAKKLLR